MSTYYNWIPVTYIEHPLNTKFVAYYGNGSREMRVVRLDGKDLAISHWYPIPELPSLADEYDEMLRVIGQ